MGLKEICDKHGISVSDWCKERLEFARGTLQKDTGHRVSFIQVDHLDPVSQEPCESLVIINADSLSKAFRDVVINKLGSVGVVCPGCGWENRVNADGEVLFYEKT
jgi:hypothetical protein